MDTQNDGLQKGTPFKYGHFGYLCEKILGGNTLFGAFFYLPNWASSMPWNFVANILESNKKDIAAATQRSVTK